jgi:hypothetical protein
LNISYSDWDISEFNLLDFESCFPAMCGRILLGDSIDVRDVDAAVMPPQRAESIEVANDELYIGVILPPISVADSSTQTVCDRVQTDLTDRLVHTRSPFDLDFYSNKSVQAQRVALNLKEEETQSEPFVGSYSGPLPLPAGLSLKQIIGAVLDHPDLSSVAIARQLGTTPSMKLVQEKPLGFLQTITLPSSSRKIFFRRRLQEAAVKARGYAYAKIEYVSVRTYLSRNRIRV